ncbi:hypothetical protein BCR44DRAFT_1430576 [Catenaria anguillulae PL171]|uniref:Uncharacterized protein n=1 Tax=Catenaria anguillulae PL171 TaxID=765915 RepID=A0A1Y2HV42_9FUNG|nr:hypothetical protein BCR44DRAFT_1430576 [Catenaria anguillulae PL171]
MCDFAAWARATIPTDMTIAAADAALGRFLSSWSTLQATLVTLSRSRTPATHPSRPSSQQNQNSCSETESSTDDDAGSPIATGSRRKGRTAKKRKPYKPPMPLKLHYLTHWSPMTRLFGSVDRQGTQHGEKKHAVTTKPSANHTPMRKMVRVSCGRVVAFLCRKNSKAI